MTDAHDSLIKGGSVGLVGGMGLNISGGTNNTVDSVAVTGCGSGGVFLDGGDRPTDYSAVQPPASGRENG